MRLQRGRGSGSAFATGLDCRRNSGGDADRPKRDLSRRRSGRVEGRADRADRDSGRERRVLARRAEQLAARASLRAKPWVIRETGLMALMKLSGNQVKAAGKVLRNPPAIHAEYVKAIEILDQWRASHAMPLQKATMGLRSRVRTAKCPGAQVSQRLKRRPTMIDKLRREPAMQLTTMHDIGGCRAVLDSVEEVRAVQRRWYMHKGQLQGQVHREYDYLKSPKTSGYRGIHLVVKYDGFPIEVQLRTRLQHAWATAVEQVGAAIHHDLKSGEGPPEILALFLNLSLLLADAEGLVEADFEAYSALREVAQKVPERVLAMIGLGVEPGGALRFNYPG